MYTRIYVNSCIYLLYTYSCKAYQKFIITKSSSKTQDLGTYVYVNLCIYRYIQPIRWLFTHINVVKAKDLGIFMYVNINCVYDTYVGRWEIYIDYWCSQFLFSTNINAAQQSVHKEKKPNPNQFWSDFHLYIDPAQQSVHYERQQRIHKTLKGLIALVPTGQSELFPGIFTIYLYIHTW